MWDIIWDKNFILLILLFVMFSIFMALYMLAALYREKIIYRKLLARYLGCIFILSSIYGLYTGDIGFGKCILYFLLGIWCLRVYSKKDKYFNDENKKEISHCKWWIKDNEYYTEHNLPYEINTMPEDMTCPICKKAIQIIDIEEEQK